MLVHRLPSVDMQTGVPSTVGAHSRQALVGHGDTLKYKNNLGSEQKFYTISIFCGQVRQGPPKSAGLRADSRVRLDGAVPGAVPCMPEEQFTPALRTQSLRPPPPS